MPSESNRCFVLFINGVGRGVSDGRGWGVVLYGLKMCMACGLMLKKKLLSLMNELLVILNHLGVVHL